MKALFTAVLVAVSALSTTAAWPHPGGHGFDPRDPVQAPQASADKEYGRPGDQSRVTRTVPVELNDRMQVEPSRWTVMRGETVKIVARNSGKVSYRVVLGTLKDLQEHAALIRKFPGMEVSQPNQMQVKPGQTAELIWHFTNAGEFSIGSPEHLDRGMVGKIIVSAQ